MRAGRPPRCIRNWYLRCRETGKSENSSLMAVGTAVHYADRPGEAKPYLKMADAPSAPGNPLPMLINRNLRVQPPNTLNDANEADLVTPRLQLPGEGEGPFWSSPTLAYRAHPQARSAVGVGERVKSEGRRPEVRPKPEGRRSKAERRPKEGRNPKAEARTALGLGFRSSDFGRMILFALPYPA